MTFKINRNMINQITQRIRHKGFIQKTTLFNLVHELNTYDQVLRYTLKEIEEGKHPDLFYYKGGSNKNGKIIIVGSKEHPKYQEFKLSQTMVLVPNYHSETYEMRSI